MWEEHSSEIASQKFAFFKACGADLSMSGFFVESKHHILNKRDDTDLKKRDVISEEVKLNHKKNHIDCVENTKLLDLIKAI